MSGALDHLSRRLRGGHWLRFDDQRRITGCHCGFDAEIEDDGWGDSVLDHFEDVLRAEIRDQTAAELESHADDAERRG